MEKDKSIIAREENASINYANVMTYPFAVPIPAKSKMSEFIKRAFTCWSGAVGVAIVILGSFLIYFYTDQIQYRSDYFKYSLLVTAISFTVIGVLVITSAVMKFLAMYAKKSGSHKFAEDFIENGPKSHPIVSDNTIVYNPLHPPILIPYTANSPSIYGKCFYNQFVPDPNFSYLPGGLFFGEDNYGLKANHPDMFLDPINDGKKTDVFVVKDGTEDTKTSSSVVGAEEEDQEDEQDDFNNLSQDSAEEKQQIERY